MEVPSGFYCDDIKTTKGYFKSRVDALVNVITRQGLINDYVDEQGIMDEAITYKWNGQQIIINNYVVGSLDKIRYTLEQDLIKTSLEGQLVVESFKQPPRI